MLYLSGAPHDRLHDLDDVGFMLTPNMGNRVDLRDKPWAADTGCFSRGGSFSLDRYLDWLARHEVYRDTCLFVTAPDVVGDAEATLERSMPVLPLLRGLGWPVAFVAQDGSELLDLPWDEFDWLFIGGSTEWKMSEEAASVIRRAHLHGKPVHMGRVNSRKRLLYAFRLGCVSADGTYLKYGPTINIPNLEAWLDEVRELEREIA